MIDNPEKTEQLISRIKKALPIEATITRYLANTLAEQLPQISMPDRCNVVDVFYTGDAGGIICYLGVSGADSKEPVIVSITHLAFDRKMTLARDIEVYQKHRIKKLKRQSHRH